MPTYAERLAATPIAHRYRCEACEEEFLSKKQLAGHQNAHVNSDCVCAHCGFTCRTPAGLLSHLRGHVRAEATKVALAARPAEEG